MADVIQRVLDGAAFGDHYQVLGAYPDGGAPGNAAYYTARFLVVKAMPMQSLKAAYMATCLATHPDKCDHPRASEAQAHVNRAWDVLRG